MALVGGETCPGQQAPVIQGPMIRLCPRATFIPDNQKGGTVGQAAFDWEELSHGPLVARAAGKCSPAACPQGRGNKNGVSATPRRPTLCLEDRLIFNPHLSDYFHIPNHFSKILFSESI